MQKITFIVIRFLCLIYITFISCYTWAITTVSCKFEPGYGYKNLTMPMLKNSLTVGRDVPLGTIISRQALRASTLLECARGAPDYVRLDLWMTYSINPKPLANWSQGPYANKVYETGVPGIGVVYNYLTRYPLPYNDYLEELWGANTIKQAFNALGTVDFIKIGPVSPGRIDAINLPSVQYNLQDSYTTTKLWDVNVSGSITIVSQTCNTPDVTVNLGDNSIEPLVSGAENETPRKNFNIELRNCPVFYGQMSKLTATNYSYWSETGETRLTEVPNTISISLNPTSGILDSNAMIAKLDDVQPNGAPKAEGVGIALYDPSGNRYKFDGHFVKVATPAIGSSGDISIPLSAAYTFDPSQPKSLIQPGSAHAAIEFTLQYN